MEEPFSASEVETMRGYFLANINIDDKGGVVAAPDQDTPGGSYYYHWMRDGALTMRSLQETSSNLTEYNYILDKYTQWVLKTHDDADPNNQDVRTEPKFMLPDGEVFSDPWCRPQNDGPGLQATSLIMYAYAMIEDGSMDYVKKYLWTGDDSVYHGGAIKYDLDYVVSGYSSQTCDLWEEIRSSDFFWNRATMKKAMSMGAEFAAMMGDAESAAKYTETKSKIASTLHEDHWSGSYWLEDVSRPKDSAVIVGFNDAFENDGLFEPTSYEVASTVNAYNTMFCTEYAVNTDDTAKNIPGVLYGRYAGDTYAGGNPWVLSTGALASLFYRAANFVLGKGGVPTDEALAMWETALNLEAGSMPKTATALAEYFAAAGDSTLLRLKAHVGGDKGHLSEQLDRNTGVQMSASDLTWSYAEVLNAMHHRDQYLQNAGKAK